MAGGEWTWNSGAQTVTHEVSDVSKALGDRWHFRVGICIWDAG